MVFDPAFTSALQQSYDALLGHYPAKVSDRLHLASAVGREQAVMAIEAMREQLITHNPLDRKTQQLVHLAMLIARNEVAAATLHIRAAHKAGATLAELHGVAETAAVVCGMPGYSLAVDLIKPLLAEPEVVHSAAT